jgi:hypothetical protein
LWIIPVAQALSRVVSDSHRRMIFEFAMDTTKLAGSVLGLAVTRTLLERITTEFHGTLPISPNIGEDRL